MNKISLITVFNNQSMVDEMINSAKRQNDADTEFIMIDNRDNKFNSAKANEMIKPEYQNGWKLPKVQA